MQISEVFYPFFECTNRYVVLYGGAGSGKSVITAQKLIARCMLEVNHRFLVIRKVGVTLRHSTYALFKALISRENLEDDFKYNESNLEITYLPNGNKVIFKGLDDPEKMKSIDGITGIWIEEATELTLTKTPQGEKGDLDQLDLRLRGKTTNYKQIIITFNPISANHWIKKRFFDDVVDDCYILKTTYLDNAFIDDEYKKVMDRLKKQNPEYYKIYALGQWGSLEGLVYDKYEVVQEMPQHFEKEYIGLDFGYNHPFSIVHIRLKDRDLYIDELIYQTDRTNLEIIEYVDESYLFVKKLPIFCDSARPDLISEWRSAGYKAEKANKAVFDGINTVKSFNLFVTKRSANIIKEFGLYAYKTDKEGQTMDEVIKLNDDAMDALRYALTPYIKRRKQIKSTKIRGI